MTRVPFGQYRGQPVERLLADESYCSWLLAGKWIHRRYPDIAAAAIARYGDVDVVRPEPESRYETSPLCRGTRADGKRCTAIAIYTLDYCRHHRDQESHAIRGPLGPARVGWLDVYQRFYDLLARELPADGGTLICSPRYMVDSGVTVSIAGARCTRRRFLELGIIRPAGFDDLGGRTDVRSSETPPGDVVRLDERRTVRAAEATG